MEEAAQRRAASVRIGAGSVPVKDRFQQKGRAKDRMSATANQRITPQAQAHCGVSSRKMKVMRRAADNQNLGGSFGGVYGVSPSP